MRAVIVTVQLLISFLLTASLMPILLVTVPATQDSRIGLGMALGIFAASFAVIALLWPKRKAARADRGRP
jgi:hypothetical protein